MALGALTLCAVSAPFVGAAPKKGPGKTLPPKAAPAKKPATGALNKGMGLMDFKATLTSRGANLLKTDYKTDHGQSKTSPDSKAEIDNRNGMTVVVAITQAYIPDPDSAPLTIRQGMSMAFASLGGFRAGQTIPIKIPSIDSRGNPPTATAIFDYTQYEVKPKLGQRPSSSRPTEHVMRSSSWVAVRGTLTIESVSSKSVKFSMKNAVFQNPGGAQNNYAKGTFVMNGSGQARITEVDDGFR